MSQLLQRCLSRLRRSRPSKIHPVTLFQPPPKPYLVLLPNEILHIIFELLNLEGESRKPLLELALTCRALWELSRVYIPKDVTLFAHSTNPTYTLFERSILADAAYAENVKSLVFESKKKKDSEEDEEVDIPAEKIASILKCLPALTTLNLNGLPHNHIKPALFDEQHPFRSCLGKLDIPGGLTVPQVAELIGYPAIRKWRFWRLGDFDCYDEFPDVDDIYLKELSFENSMIAKPLFDNVLKRCRNLKMLECNLPFSKMAEKSTVTEAQIDEVFSAAQISKSLEWVKETLTKLQLQSHGQAWKGEDETSLDLSDWPELMNVELSALCLFSPLSKTVSRDGSYKLFPRSTETIKIHFPTNGFGIFFSAGDGKINAEEYSRFLFNGAGAVDAHWIHEFALNKATALPNLREFILYEDITSPGEEDYESQDWTIPSYLKSAFDDAQISLSVALRKNATKT
ncbi:hypothetical protein EJ04DRAFT_568477 [Polyplosphaeria fusca]|uniref:F-box domain-containing protein n=1 Tax=Polyplosphaeria fusca TaxID=682080 RepID=A0A9P4QQ53_9PLEO|nr:hypothetical protein EJ04DRAFT_568477 [Polyplosphaeria fusca]